MTITTGQMILTGFVFVVSLSGAFLLGWDLCARHYQKWHGHIAEDYQKMSKEFETLARRMSNSDEIRAGIDLGQESVLTEFERLTAHMRETLEQR